MIPMNAVGVLATNNNEPARYVGTTADTLIYDIVEKSNTRMYLRVRVQSSTAQNVYLGAISSPDGSNIYWINETRPLP